jgi:hypothetical protein
VAVCGPPTHAATFGRVLVAIDPDALQRALTGWVLARRRARRGQRAPDARPLGEERAVLAVDGKTLRGARDPNRDQVTLVAVFDGADGWVLSQVQVVDCDELAAFATVLDAPPDLRDVVITADALHCQRPHADYLHGRGAHYLFTVKANQPTLRTALARLPWARCAACATGRSDTAGWSPARSRSSTWTARRRPGCSRTASGRSKRSAPAAAPARRNRRR